MGAPQKAEIPTQQISREAFFDLKHTRNPSLWTKACRAVGRYTQPISLFPFPGASKFRLQYLTDSPAKSFTRHVVVGTVIGLAVGGVWKYWHHQVYNVRKNDFYKQLSKANAGEVEKLRLRLVDEAKEVRSKPIFFT